MAKKDKNSLPKLPRKTKKQKERALAERDADWASLDKEEREALQLEKRL